VKLECDENMIFVAFFVAAAFCTTVIVALLLAYHAYATKQFVLGHYCEAVDQQGRSRWVSCAQPTTTGVPNAK
jgi:hypothetical protein